MEILHSTNPHEAWLNYPGHVGATVRIRIFWHRTPLQHRAVGDLIRAAAAELLPLVDSWRLTPSRPWLTAARRLAGAGLLPIPDSYEPATQLLEYRRVLPGRRFRIEAGLSDRLESLSDGVAALTRTLRWADELLGQDAVFFIAKERARDEPDRPIEDLEPEIIAAAPRGKPHPLSPSEQKLAIWLGRDQDLCTLFSYNSLVRLSPVSQPCVDLLWEAGKLVVEVDDASHWRKDKYAADRQRDFELIASGFMVLRITADEVLSDTAKVLNKIRTCVELRRKS